MAILRGLLRCDPWFIFLGHSSRGYGLSPRSLNLWLIQKGSRDKAGVRQGYGLLNAPQAAENSG